MEVVDLLLALLAQDEVVHHPGAQRARTVERQHRDDVLEAIGGKLLEQLLHALRFHLEDRGGIGILEDLVGRGVLESQAHQVRPFAGKLFDVLEGEFDDGEVAQPEEVELHQPDRLDVVLVELRHRRGVLAVGNVERTKIGELARRDQHTPRVHAHATGQALQRQGQLPQLGHRLAITRVGHHLADLRLLLARLGEAERLVLHHRDQLGEPIAQAVRQVQHPADIPHHRL